MALTLPISPTSLIFEDMDVRVQRQELDNILMDISENDLVFT